MEPIILESGQTITIEPVPVTDIQPGDKIVPSDWVAWAYAEVVSVDVSPSWVVVTLNLHETRPARVTTYRSDQQVAKVVSIS